MKSKVSLRACLTLVNLAAVCSSFRTKIVTSVSQPNTGDFAKPSGKVSARILMDGLQWEREIRELQSTQAKMEMNWKCISTTSTTKDVCLGRGTRNSDKVLLVSKVKLGGHPSWKPKISQRREPTQIFNAELNQLDAISQRGVRTVTYFAKAGDSDDPPYQPRVVFKKGRETHQMEISHEISNPGGRLFPVPCVSRQGASDMINKTFEIFNTIRQTIPEKVVELHHLGQTEHFQQLCVGMLMTKLDGVELEPNAKVDVDGENSRDPLITWSKQLLSGIERFTSKQLNQTLADFKAIKISHDSSGLFIKDLQGWLNTDDGKFTIADPSSAALDQPNDEFIPRVNAAILIVLAKQCKDPKQIAAVMKLITELRVVDFDQKIGELYRTLRA